MVVTSGRDQRDSASLRQKDRARSKGRSARLFQERHFRASGTLTGPPRTLPDPPVTLRAQVQRSGQRSRKVERQPFTSGPPRTLQDPHRHSTTR